MKHIFVINPAAGKINAYDYIKNEIEKSGVKEEYELYVTQAPEDATAFIRKYCTEHEEEPVRFYACGGDGTLNEVVNGVVGFPFASVGCYPSGSGNDFVKYYGGKKSFGNIADIMYGTETPIDVIKVGNRYAINAAHFGFDSCVAKTMTNIRRKKLIGGKNAYTTSVLVGLLKGMVNKCTVEADGELLNPKGKILLCTIANGQYVGGSFRCAPKSRNDDGLLEVCLVYPVSHITFLSLVKYYTEGTHLDNPKFSDRLIYRRAKSVHIIAPEGFTYSFDGELITQNDFTVEVVHHGIKFVVPRGAKTIVEENNPDLEEELTEND